MNPDGIEMNKLLGGCNQPIVVYDIYYMREIHRYGTHLFNQPFSCRTDVKKSPTNYLLERDLTEPKHKVPENTARKVPISLRSPQRDIDNRSGDRKKMPVVSRENYLSNSESPTEMRKVNARTSRRYCIPDLAGGLHVMVLLFYIY